MAESVVTVDSSPLQCNVSAPIVWRIQSESITCSAVIPWGSADVADALPLSKSFCIDRSSPSLAKAIKSSWMGCIGEDGMSSSSRCPLPLLVGALGVVMTAGRSRLGVAGPSLAAISRHVEIKNHRCILVDSGSEMFLY